MLGEIPLARQSFASRDRPVDDGGAHLLDDVVEGANARAWTKVRGSS
jgi:hypothetical protein